MLQVVGDIGVKTNQDRTSSTSPVYLLGGFIYSPKEMFDIGFGIKGGLTKTESDITVYGALSWRF